MPLHEVIQNSLCKDDIEKINTVLEELMQFINGKTVNLTPGERRKYGSINTQHKQMVNRIYELHTSHPQFNCDRVNWVEFGNSFTLHSSLETIVRRLYLLAELLENSKILHAHDNYRQALQQYRYISYLADQNEPEVVNIRKEVARFFSRTGTGG